MDTRSTIVAISSPPGPSPIGIVRLSGTSIAPLLADHCPAIDVSSRGVRSARLEMSSFEVPAIILCMPEPRSFTGESVVELQVPGNPFLLDQIVEELINSGVRRGLTVRRAVAGEFTYRAWLHGKLLLDQAEGIAALIAASSDEECNAANRMVNGETGEQLRTTAEELAHLLAQIEAGIDFADEEDVVLLTVEELRQAIQNLISRLSHLLSASTGEVSVDASPRVVLRGPANAGKSTLFNAILQKERMVTHEVVGTTRDVVEEHVLLDGLDVLLIDTPGDENEADVSAVRAESESDIILWCDPEGNAPEGTVSVRTKRDLASNPGSPPAFVCAFDRHDVESLRQAVAAAIRSRARAGELLGASLRQRGLMRSAVGALSEAQEVVALDDPNKGASRPAEAAALLRLALDDIGAVTGEIPPDDVLGLVFSGFCIGK